MYQPCFGSPELAGFGVILVDARRVARIEGLVCFRRCEGSEITETVL